MERKTIKFLVLIVTLIIANIILVHSDNGISLNNVLFETEWKWLAHGFERSRTLIVRFLEDGVFEATDWFGESLLMLKGTYKIKDNDTLELRYVIFSGYDLDPLGKYENEDELIKDKGMSYTLAKLKILPHSVHYTLLIECENGIYLTNDDYRVKAGLKREIDGIPVITMGGKRGEAIENVRIRPKPSLFCDYYEYNGGMGGRYPYYPQGYCVNVYARTVEKEKIGEWNNYWYYAELKRDTRDMKTGWVWMYGEFIALTE